MSVTHRSLPQLQSSSSWHPSTGTGQPSGLVSPTSVSNISNTQIEQHDDTLSRIEDAANKDIEMKDVPSGGYLFLVLDTNVLIDQLTVLKRFCIDIEGISLPLFIIIPNVVLSELDGLKNRDELKWFAQTASRFLLDKVKEKKSIKVQARSETCDIKSDDPLRRNDMAIFDCCCYFKKKGSLVLLSADRNLCIECEKEEIPTICPPKRSWTSRELAKALFAHHVDLDLFHGHERDPSYRRARTLRKLGITEGPVQDSGDGMDVDDDNLTMADPEEEFIPSHALDALHLQVIDHFTLILKEVAEQVRISSGDNGPPSGSQYAPAYRRKEFAKWNVGDCLSYLGSKKPFTRTSPDLRVFLLKRNEDLGWRRGQDWSRQDWKKALGALREVGEKFGDGSVLSGLEALEEPQVDEIFNAPMRPTGI